MAPGAGNACANWVARRGGNWGGVPINRPSGSSEGKSRGFSTGANGATGANGKLWGVGLSTAGSMEGQGAGLWGSRPNNGAGQTTGSEGTRWLQPEVGLKGYIYLSPVIELSKIMLD